MSVNDLLQYADSLLDRGEFWENVNIALPGEVDDLEDEVHILKNAWHPISQPPTEEDGDDHGLVLAYLRSEGKDWIVPQPLHVFQDGTVEDETLWARIRDVVLFPEKPF